MISHPHKTIFIHIPKCAGQSIESAFLEDLGLDWSTRAPLLLRPNSNTKIGPPRLAHLTARQYVEYHYVSEELFKSYYSFSVLRDPIDRVISTYNYMNIKNKSGEFASWKTFLYNWLPEKMKTKNFFVLPQSDYILDLSGEVMVNDLFMLNTLEEKFPVIKEKAMLRCDLGHVNISDKRVKRTDLTEKDYKYIHDIYDVDFSLIRKIQAFLPAFPK